MKLDQVFRKWFDRSEEEVKRLLPIVEKVNALESQCENIHTDDFPKKTQELKERLKAGESLDDVLPIAFALVREVSKRKVHMRHFDVQVLGGVVLHEGKIAEMKTGEGKTLVATMPLYLNALTERGVHLVTVNDYLARRDAVWMGPIYHTLGLSVGVIQGQSPDSDELGGSYIYEPGFQHDDPRYTHLRPCTRRQAYECDVVYGTNHEFGFDYLRDNMVFEKEDLSMGDLHYAIIDEVDSILIDEARTPHIISGASSEPIEIYKQVDAVVKRLKSGSKDQENEVDYIVDKKNHSASLTERGYDKIEELMGLDNLANHPELMHYVNASIKAYGLFDKDVEYVVKEGQVVLVDENTGRLMFGRRLSEGLHQALEAKENVPVQRESQTVAVITFQNLFRLYEKLGGMTGTAKTEEDEFLKIYGLSVVVVPTHRKMIRIDHPDVIFKTEEAKYRAISREILRLWTKQQPVLVGTRSIEMSERISARLMPDKLQKLLLAEHIKQTLQNSKGISKGEKNEYYKALSGSLVDKPQKELAQIADKLGVPKDPLSEDMMNWFLTTYELPPENKPNLEEALKHGIPHNVLNAKYHEREALIIAEAGRKGAITIATNMAGRGVDILLGGRVSTDEIQHSSKQDEDFESGTFAPHRRGGKERAAPPLPLDDQERAALAEEVRKLGGLYILGTERHESRRIDNQLRGRSGRQGDPGESRYYVSLEDQLWKIFNPKMLENPMMRAWPDFEEVDAKFLSSMIEKTQKRIELHFFESRKYVLEYDDVLNAQREHIYSMRREYVLGKDPAPAIHEYLDDALWEIIEKHSPQRNESETWEYDALFRDLLMIFPAMDFGSPKDLEGLLDSQDIFDKIKTWMDDAYAKHKGDFTDEEFKRIEKYVLLQAITSKWTEHLQQIERLREGIGLRGYGHIDPLVAFKKESHALFEDTLKGIRDAVATSIYRARFERRPSPPIQMRRLDNSSTATTAGNGETDWSKVKRNDPCPCGSGKKFKNCHYREVMGGSV